jgi:diacylglycerol kinase (ATP)
VRGCVLLNPQAGSAGEADALRQAVTAAGGFTLHESRSAEEASRRATEAAREGYDLIVAAGGDGTVHDIVNALVGSTDGRAGEGPTFAVIPLGTGNDLARTLCLPEDPVVAFELAQKGARRQIDLLRVETPEGATVAVNAVTGGFSGTVSEQMSPELKRALGPLAYLVGAARALPDLAGYTVRLAWDGGPEEPADVLNLAVANGRTAAGGQRIAPEANPEDGLLEVVIIRPGPAAELAGLAPRFMAGDYMDHPLVVHRRARTLRVSARPAMWFSVDGERVEHEEVTFSVLPGALRVVVGPRYRAEPPAPPR